MEYECKKCGNKFTKSFGTARCPNCRSKNLWIISGATKQILLGLAIMLILLVIALLIHLIIFFGALIGCLVAFPISVLAIFRKRKKSI